MGTCGTGLDYDILINASFYLLSMAFGARERRGQAWTRISSRGFRRFADRQGQLHEAIAYASHAIQPSAS